MSELIIIVLGIALLLGMTLLIPITRTHKKRAQHIDKVFVGQKWKDIVHMAGKPDQSARFAII